MSHFGFFLFRSYGLSCPIAYCPNCGSPFSRRNVEKYIAIANFYPCHRCWTIVYVRRECPLCGEPLHKPERGYHHKYECLNPKCSVISVTGKRVRRDSRKLERAKNGT